MKKKLKKTAALLLTLAICVNTADISAYATEENTSGELQEESTIDEEEVINSESTNDNEVTNEDKTTDNDVVTDGENVQSTWDGVTIESVYEGTNYRVKFTLSGYWQGGYNASITIENTGESTIENWSLKFPFQDNISNIWNASIDKKQGGTYIIKNAGWNQDIPAFGSVDFGFSVSNDFTGFPVEYEMLGQINEKHEEDYSVEYIVNSDWGDGFTASVNITNNTNWTLEDWVLEFDYARQIDNIWNAVIATHEGDHYVITNAGYNANISAGQTISFGFQGSKGTISDKPTGYKLHSYEDDTSLRDSDGDGLTDEWEIAMGLDPYAKDTDKDGLTDYEEVYLTLTNPLEPDTDGDGIIDGEDDMDGEGLTNREELDMGTDPLKSDTDGDNLTDYEEVHDYGTNPLLEDTDGDGLTDYDDVILGFSPLLADTDGNGIIDSQEKLYQTKAKTLQDAKNDGVTEVSVSLTVKGNIENKVAIEDVYEIDALSSGVVGLIGVPVDICCSEEFEKADITFHYDVSALGDTEEEDLSVMWYDEENDWYQILDEDSVVDTQNHTVTYSTTHFSTYMLVDSQKWYDAWRENIDYRNSASGDTEKHYFDIAFVIDVSGSMSGTRITKAKEAINSFIDSMQGNDEAAVIAFNSNAVLCSDFSNDKDSLRQVVNKLSASGGTSVNAGMLTAIDAFEKHECDKQNIVVLICDGDGLYDIFETAGIRLPNGQIIYTDPTKQDTDGDGLTDYQETGIVYEVDDRYIGDHLLRWTHFEMRSDPTLPDTDGDGITDDVDDTPWMVEQVLVAKLDNKFGDWAYLNIKESDQISYNGGDQNWWADKASHQKVENEVEDTWHLMTDEYYRLKRMGCGTVAMSDAELYMAMQNNGYSLSVSTALDTSIGICDKDVYRDYLEQMYHNVYPLDGSLFSSTAGLAPWLMDSGFRSFLKRNGNSKTNVTWAKNSIVGINIQKQYVLETIEEMLNDNIPVVFSCHDPDKPIMLYKKFEYVKPKNPTDSSKPESHYMTIVGLYKYADKNPMDYKYVLEVVSWGEIYYIDYDEYADKLSYVSNILSVY